MILYRTTRMFFVCVSVHFSVKFRFMIWFSRFFCNQWSSWVFFPFSLLQDPFSLFSNSRFFLFYPLRPDFFNCSFLFVFLSFWLHDMLCCYCYICGLTSLLEALRFQRTSLPCIPRLFSLPVQLIYAQNHPDLFCGLFFTSCVPIPPPLGFLLFGPLFCRTSWVRPSALWGR